MDRARENARTSPRTGPRVRPEDQRPLLSILVGSFPGRGQLREISHRRNDRQGSNEEVQRTSRIHFHPIQRSRHGRIRLWRRKRGGGPYTPVYSTHSRHIPTGLSPVTFVGGRGSWIVNQLPPPPIRPGFLATSVAQSDGTVSLRLQSITGLVSSLPIRVSLVRCQVTDPGGRTFTRQIEVGPYLSKRLAIFDWPGDFTSGDLLTGCSSLLVARRSRWFRRRSNIERFRVQLSHPVALTAPGVASYKSFEVIQQPVE